MRTVSMQYIYSSPRLLDMSCTPTMAIFNLVALCFCTLTALSQAFWRMPCRSRTGLARIDPIMSPGTVSEHAHAIHGGNSGSPRSHSTRSY